MTTPEPLPADSLRWDLPNVLLTAHTAVATPQHRERGLTLVGEEAAHVLADEPLRNRFNPATGY